MKKKFLHYLKSPYVIGLFILFFLWIFFSNSVEFDVPTSTLLESNDGNLLAAKIASDGQWRFPEIDSVPEKFQLAIRYFEDEYFYVHPGINPVSIFRALWQNIRAGKIVSGGSTITMQVVRLDQGNSRRTIFQKIKEIIKAVHLELAHSKKEILCLYASHAPFGGNIVGLEAAAWRYYSRPPSQLSWGEITTLAVLPNAPSLIYPGKNQEQLLIKRNRLLDKLYKKNVIDQTTSELAKEEPLPGRPKPLPSIAGHLLERACKEGHEGKRIITSIDFSLQKQAYHILSRYHHLLKQNEVYNAAVLVLDVVTGNTLAYLGNTNCGDVEEGCQVDIITSPRSTGSVMKPFLYASMLNDGIILPNTLIPDIPTYIAGYSPKNFEKSYDGAVPAGNALSRSLNVSAVRMLREYGIDKFHDVLQKLKITSINQPAGHYGLSVILGGAEATLWELTGCYAAMARTLNNYRKYYSIQPYYNFSMPDYIKTDKGENKNDQPVFSAAAIWQTMEVLSSVRRPREESGWEQYASSKKIAWKTGTSFGHRDAWAIGTTPRYTVGVWIGNADGEGRPGLTGISTAAPLLFEIFKLLPESEWFVPPYDELAEIPVCKNSGYRAGELCEVDSVYVPAEGLKTEVCPYHKLIHLDKEGKYRVSGDCYSVADMISVHWFVLPPAQEWYYKSKNAHYKVLPPFNKECEKSSTHNPMEIIYPRHKSSVYVPVNLTGQKEKIVMEAAHHDENAFIYWHLNDEFIGQTKGTHQITYAPSPGEYVLTLVDQAGESVVIQFNVVRN